MSQRHKNKETKYIKMIAKYFYFSILNITYFKLILFTNINTLIGYN